MTELSELRSEGSQEKARGRPPAPLPKMFAVLRDADGLSIDWPWSGGLGGLVMGIFIMFLLGMGLFFYMFFGWLPLIFFGLFVCVFTYFLVNHTRIEVRRGVLSIRHYPLPAPGSRELRVDDIDQLFTREHVSTDSDGDSSYSYQIWALLRSPKKPIRLISGLNKPEQALYLEQSLEEHLGIVDRPVAGELDRDEADRILDKAARKSANEAGARS